MASTADAEVQAETDPSHGSSSSREGPCTPPACGSRPTTPAVRYPFGIDSDAIASAIKAITASKAASAHDDLAASPGFNLAAAGCSEPLTSLRLLSCGEQCVVNAGSVSAATGGSGDGSEGCVGEASCGSVTSWALGGGLADLSGNPDQRLEQEPEGRVKVRMGTKAFCFWGLSAQLTHYAVSKLASCDQKGCNGLTDCSCCIWRSALTC